MKYLLIESEGIVMLWLVIMEEFVSERLGYVL